KVEGARKKELAYQAAMKEAKTAFDGKKWADAVKHYDEALQNKPGDKAATDGKKAAQTEFNKTEEANRKEVTYQAAMKEGKAAFDAKRYAEAVKGYNPVLGQKASDPAALAGRKAGQAELNKVEETKKKEAAYQAAMKEAKTAFDAKKY